MQTGTGSGARLLIRRGTAISVCQAADEGEQSSGRGRQPCCCSRWAYVGPRRREALSRKDLFQHEIAVLHDAHFHRHIRYRGSERLREPMERICTFILGKAGMSVEDACGTDICVMRSGDFIWPRKEARSRPSKNLIIGCTSGAFGSRDNYKRWTELGQWATQLGARAEFFRLLNDSRCVGQNPENARNSIKQAFREHAFFWGVVTRRSVKNVRAYTVGAMTLVELNNAWRKARDCLSSNELSDFEQSRWTKTTDSFFDLMYWKSSSGAASSRAHLIADLSAPMERLVDDFRKVVTEMQNIVNATYNKRAGRIGHAIVATRKHKLGPKTFEVWADSLAVPLLDLAPDGGSRSSLGHEQGESGDIGCRSSTVQRHGTFWADELLHPFTIRYLIQEFFASSLDVRSD